MNRGFITTAVIMGVAALAVLGILGSLAMREAPESFTEEPFVEETEEGDTFGADPRILTSRQLAASPQNGYILSTDGTNNSWIVSSGGAGGSGFFVYEQEGADVLSPSVASTSATARVQADSFHATSTATSSTFVLASSTSFTATNSYLGTVQSGTWNGTAIDISDYTNLTADGTEIILTDDALSLGTTLSFDYASTTAITATNFYGALTGTASLATALGANGANCSAGNAPLGVDASGAVESCFDVWTEAENTSAGYISGNETITLSGDVTGSGATSITTAIGAGVIIEPDLDADVAPADGDYLQYDSTGTNFTWREASEMRSDLSLVVGTNVQAYDADLTTYAGITPSANVQSLLGAANYGAMRTLLDLEAGTDFYSLSSADSTFAKLGAANAFTVGGHTITVADTANVAGLTINQNDVTNEPYGMVIGSAIGALYATQYLNTSAGSDGSFVEFYHNSASPAANDFLGGEDFYGNDSGANKTLYAYFNGRIEDPTNTSEDGHIQIGSRVAGALAGRLFVGRALNGIHVGDANTSGIVSSNGNQDLTLQTGNSTTGNITITDGANGNITVSPNGTGKFDLSSALVKQHTYKSFTWPGTPTTTTATTTVPLGTAYTAEAWNGAECYTTSGTSYLVFTDGTNDMNPRTATTTVGRFTLSSNNTFTASEKRYVEIGALTAAQLSCTIDITINST